MRSCPSCNSPKRSVIEKEYTHTSIINNGVEAGLSRFECSICGFHYLDGEVNQKWFDWYYLNVYRTDDDPYSEARLDSLAECVLSYKPRVMLDIGGLDGKLQSRLDSNSCDVAGVGDGSKAKYDTVILSHTLEHIYDIPAMMERVKSNLHAGGRLFIEIPIHLDYKDLSYDRHWQHVNKFRPVDVERILIKNNFDVEINEQLPDYREYNVWRIVGVYEPR